MCILCKLSCRNLHSNQETISDALTTNLINRDLKDFRNPTELNNENTWSMIPNNNRYVKGLLLNK